MVEKHRPAGWSNSTCGWKFLPTWEEVLNLRSRGFNPREGPSSHGTHSSTCSYEHQPMWNPSSTCGWDFSPIQDTVFDPWPRPLIRRIIQLNPRTWFLSTRGDDLDPRLHTLDTWVQLLTYAGKLLSTREIGLSTRGRNICFITYGTTYKVSFLFSWFLNKNFDSKIWYWTSSISLISSIWSSLVTTACGRSSSVLIPCFFLCFFNRS